MKAPLCGHLECWSAAIDGALAVCPDNREQIERLKRITGISNDADVCVFALRLLDYLLKPGDGQPGCLDCCDHGVEIDSHHPCMECATECAEGLNDAKKEGVL